MGCCSSINSHTQEPAKKPTNINPNNLNEDHIDLVINLPQIDHKTHQQMNTKEVNMKPINKLNESLQNKIEEPPKKTLPDMILENLVSKVIIKEQINKASCKVLNCTHSKIYLHDCMQTVSVTNSHHCEIFIGPSVSVSLEQSTKCRVITCSKSLTISQCNSIKLLVFSETPPIIKDSTSIRLGCFSYFYAELQEQFECAGLDVWNNRWSEVEDCEYFPESVKWWDIIQRKEAAEAGDISPPGSFYESSQAIVPLTLGRSKDINNKTAVVFLNYNNKLLMNVYEAIRYKVLLLNTKSMTITRDELSKIIGNIDISYKKLKIVIMIIGCEDNITEVEEIIKKLYEENSLYISHDPTIVQGLSLING